MFIEEWSPAQRTSPASLLETLAPGRAFECRVSRGHTAYSRRALREPTMKIKGMSGDGGGGYPRLNSLRDLSVCGAQRALGQRFVGQLTILCHLPPNHQ